MRHEEREKQARKRKTAEEKEIEGRWPIELRSASSWYRRVRLEENYNIGEESFRDDFADLEPFSKVAARSRKEDSSERFCRRLTDESYHCYSRLSTDYYFRFINNWEVEDKRPSLMLFRGLSKQYDRSWQQHYLQIHLRTFVDPTIKWVRDRGLDHVVEKEKNLTPMMNIKNFIKAEPSKSVPISVITQNKESLKIPMRPIDLIRKYPSIFEEFLPGGIGIHPHIRLTSEALEIDAEEQLTYQSDTYRQLTADRLLRLLMLTRALKVPISVIDHLQWDLGLPPDYVQSIVSEFPHYFQILRMKNSESQFGDTRMLDLVCWSSELATSVMEKRMITGSGCSKGMPLVFPMQFSKGFEMDKKFKKWVDEWQKLPYVSPYENAYHLPQKSDESDKWAVAVLHELLHILIGKKTEKDNLLYIGAHLGLRSRFKRALLHHPGIFYLSSKLETYTVVLKEGYKRGSLVENHPLMIVRNKYLHLMNVAKVDSKPTSKPRGVSRQWKKVDESEETIDENGGDEEDEFETSDSGDECASEHDNDNEKGDEHKNQAGVRRGRHRNKGASRDSGRERSVKKHRHRTRERSPLTAA